MLASFLLWKTWRTSCPSVQDYVRTPKVEKQKPRKLTAAAVSSGAFNRNRTDDLILTMDALYRLSYKGKCILWSG